MTRTVWPALALVAVLGVAAPACGGGKDGKQSTPSDTAAKSYVGLTEKEAIGKAKSEGRPWRITRKDDETFLVTLDYNPERINFEIDHGKVTKATYG